MHEIFQYPFERDKLDHNFSKEYLKNLKKESRKAQIMNILYGNFDKQTVNNVDYIFFGLSYLDLIDSMPKSSILVIGGVKNKKTIEKGNNSYFPIYYFLPKLMKIFHSDPMMKKKSTIRFILQVVSIFKKLSPKCLVLPNDSLFLERFLIFCARKAGVKTICIQHGLVQSKTNPIILDGKYADYMYVWSEKQEKIFLQSGVLSTKLRVMGYPHQIKTNHVVSKYKSKLKICLLGQPWEKYNTILGIKKKEIFELIYEYLPGYDIVYKPHPGENDIQFLPESMVLFNGSLLEALNSYDLFISLTSTALIEASLYEKVSIQIYDKQFDCDSFEDIGYCYTLTSDKLVKIEEFIKNINSPFMISQNVIKCNDKLGTVFSSLVEKNNFNIGLKHEYTGQ